MMEFRTCLADCGMKVQTCIEGKFTDAKMKAATAVMDAKMRFMAAQTELQTKIADWKTKIMALQAANVRKKETPERELALIFTMSF
jgi:hypothetical protein